MRAGEICTCHTPHAFSPHTSREVCVWEYGVLFFGQVGTWSTTLPWHLSNVPDVASGRMHAGEICTCHTSHAFSPHTSREVCVWEYGVLFFGQVGTWSTTLP